MVDEPRLIPINGSVDHHIIVDRKEISVMTYGLIIGIASVGFSRRQPLARILDETRAAGDSLGCERTKTLYR